MNKIDVSFYKPHPWQDRLDLSPATFKAAIGGFGSGKTTWLIFECFKLAMKYPKNYGIISRQTYDELDSTTHKLFVDNIPCAAFKKIEKTKRLYTFVNDSVIQFLVFNNIRKIKNMNIGFYALDQAEEFTESYFDTFLTRFKLNVPVKYEGILAANSLGKNWIWRRFVKKTDPDFAYEISETEDNKKYLPEGYIERMLKNLPKKWQDRYMHSSFEDFVGSVYYNYNNFKCQMNMTDMNFRTDEYKILVGIDPGIDAPTGVLFGAFSLKDFILYLFDEIYETLLSPKQIKFLIDRKLEKWKIEKVWKFLIDPHSSTRELSSKNSVFKEYRNCGLNVQLADENVNIGILRVNTMFGNEDDTKIKTNISLESFYNEIENYVFAVSKQEMEGGYVVDDKPRGVNDHLMTTLKFIVLGLPIQWIDEDIRKRDEGAIKSRKLLERRFMTLGRGKNIYTRY